MSSDSKYEQFTQYLTTLIKRLQSMNCDSNKSLESTFSSLDKFGTLFSSVVKLDSNNKNFDRTKKVASQFERLLSRNAEKVFNTSNDDRWIRNDNIKIRVNDNPDYSNIYIDFSDLYLLSRDLSDHAKGVTPELDSPEYAENQKAIIRPQMVVLSLLKIFYCLSTEEVQKRIVPNIAFYEDSVNLPVERRLIMPESNKGFNAGLQLSNMFNTVAGIAKGFGIDVGNNKIDPDMLNNMLSNVANNPKVAEFGKNIITSINNGDMEGLSNIGQSAIKEVTEKFPALNQLKDKLDGVERNGVYTPPQVVDLQKRLEEAPTD